jgi:ATP-dependent RNA helicase DHX57
VLKVVVATNVAETSITIDDVTCVIDAGRVKEMGFDPGRGIARLLEGWVSRASAAQRRGRAGRVRPGVCYRLYSRATWEGMAADTPPEVSRAPLQGLVMDVKGILRGGDAEAALGEMVTPPSAGALAQAVGALQAIGALARAPGAPLTPLGLHLLRMPCDPRLGKMLVFGAMLRCLDPVLTVAAAQAHGRPAFFSPPDKRAEAEAARAALTRDVAASKSDHLATVAAYNEWRAAVARGGRAAGSALCARSFLSEQVMEGIHQGRRQYADILTELGFVPRGYSAAAAAHAYSPGGVGAAGGGAGAEAYTRAGGVDEFAGHARIVKAALCAGLYPQLLRVDHPPAKFAAAAGGAFEVDSVARELKFFDRERGRVFLHPSSSNFARGRFESGWLVFSELVQTSRVFVRESSMVPVYAVLLFGGEPDVWGGRGGGGLAGAWGEGGRAREGQGRGRGTNARAGGALVMLSVHPGSAPRFDLARRLTPWLRPPPRAPPALQASSACTTSTRCCGSTGGPPSARPGASRCWCARCAARWRRCWGARWSTPGWSWRAAAWWRPCTTCSPQTASRSGSGAGEGRGVVNVWPPVALPARCCMPPAGRLRGA